MRPFSPARDWAAASIATVARGGSVQLLDRKDSETRHYYASRLETDAGVGPEEGGLHGVHFHPVDPISVRVALTARF